MKLMLIIAVILIFIAVIAVWAYTLIRISAKPRQPVMRPCGRFICPLSWTDCEYCSENPKNAKENVV